MTSTAFRSRLERRTRAKPPSPPPVATAPPEPEPEPATDPADQEFASRPGSWYVLQVASGREDTTAKHLKALQKQPELEDHILEVMTPTQEELPPRDSGRKPKAVKLYPGYVLARLILDEPTHQAIRQAPGVIGFVGSDPEKLGVEDPTPLTPQEAASMTGLNQAAPPRRAAPYKVGELVEIAHGSFSQFTAVVSSIDEKKNRAWVKINILGRETPMEIDIDDAKTISPAS